MAVALSVFRTEAPSSWVSGAISGISMRSSVTPPASRRCSIHSIQCMTGVCVPPPKWPMQPTLADRITSGW